MVGFIILNSVSLNLLAKILGNTFKGVSEGADSFKM